MADAFEDIMEGHFLNAGIEPDKKPDDENKQEEVKTEEKKPDAASENNDGLNLEKSLDEPKTGEQAKEGQQPPTDGKDKQSSGVDGKAKSGEEAKGEVALNPGDLKLADGSIVRAGAERRHYEAARVARTEVSQLRQEINTERQTREAATAKLQEYETAAKQVGLENPVDMQNAIRLYKDLRTDVVGTLKQLLADAKAMGHTIEGIGAGVDTAALIELLNQKLAPVTQQQQEQSSVEAAQEKAKKDVETFFTGFPDARLHDGFIAMVMEANPNLSMSDAYLELKTAAIEQGFDWSKDLGPQIEAKVAAEKAKGGQQQQQQQPAPIGGRAIAEDDKVEIDPSKHVTQGDDWGAIIREAIAQSK